MAVLFKAALLAAAVAAASDDALAPKDLKVDSVSSILGVAKTLAAGVMSYYSGNASTYAELPDPYYWWEAGALMGAMLDYSHYTNDTTYDDIVVTALASNIGPTADFMVPKHNLDEGNDDQAFWAFTALAAAERNFTQPAGMPSWLDVSINVWNSMAARWNTTTCGGGLPWQIFAFNFNGLNYKNSASNGGLFHLSARLARLTGNQTYVDWATKVWDWTAGVGMIDGRYNVFDGTDSLGNCTEINPLSFTYQNGIFLYGAAVLANHTGSPAWARRAQGLLGSASAFFSPFPNATNVMWEHACEGVGTCTKDMKAFKAFLSRFLYASSVMLPALEPNISTYMRASAAAAGAACSGVIYNASIPSANGTTCGQKWYVGGFDSSVGLGQELSALEAVHGLLLLDGVKDDRPPATTTAPAPSPTATKKSSAPGTPAPGLRWTVLGLLCTLFVLGLA